MSRTLHDGRRLFQEAFAPRAGGALERVAFSLLLLVVVAAPLPFGGVLPGGQLLIELLAFCIAAATFLSKGSVPRLGSGWIAAGSVLALAVLGLLQLLPLPDGLLRLLSPVSAEIYHETAQVLTPFGRTEIWRPRISIAPDETANVIRLTLAYAALFVGAARLLVGRARRRLFCAVFLLGAVLHVAVAAPLQIGEGRLHGSFVNPNHFAAYLEIALAVAFGVAWAEVLVNAERGRSLTERAERIERRFLPLAWRVLVWVVLAVGIGLTQSRAGVVTALLVTALLVLVAIAHGRVRRRREWSVGGALALVSGLVLVAAIARGAPLLRFLTSDPREVHGGLRVELWKTSVDAWKQFPVLGSGLGTFRESFRRVQPRSLNGLVEQAHSDPLQMLVTGGVIGELLAATAVVSLLVLLLRRWKGQMHREESALILGGFGALLSVTLHGLVDFPMSIPSIPAVLAGVLGMAWSAGSRGGGRP